MEKQLVVVVIINVDEDQLPFVNKSIDTWKDRTESAYSAKIRLEKVGQEG